MKHQNESSPPDEFPPPAGLSALRRDGSPARDLWPGIESRIAARRSRSRQFVLWAGPAMAATLALALGLGVEYGGRHEPLRAPRDVAAALEPVVSGDLIPVVNRPVLHPETRALVRANIKLVNNAEAQLKRALVQDPDGEYLKNLLATAHQQKQDLHVALAEQP